MKKKLTRYLLTLAVALACVLSMGLTAFAAELPGGVLPAGVIDVKIGLTGQAPSPVETYAVKLVPTNRLAPLPAGAVNGVYTLELAGPGTASFPAIDYSKVGVGIYSYKIYQEPGSHPNIKKDGYDSTVYYLDVYVLNAQSGSGLEYEVALRAGSSADKLDLVSFTNNYNQPSRPGYGPQTGDDSQFGQYLVLAGLSTLVLLALYFTRKDPETQE